jgi:hypothetical protein
MLREGRAKHKIGVAARRLFGNWRRPDFLTDADSRTGVGPYLAVPNRRRSVSSEATPDRIRRRLSSPVAV